MRQDLVSDKHEGEGRKMSVRIEGIDNLQKQMAKLADEYGKNVARAAYRGGQMVRATAIKSIQEKSPGEAVTRSRAGGGQYHHVAAAPDAAPNTDTGRLVSSIQVEVKGGDVFVGSTLQYAGWLEYGTRSMLARPWLMPALEQNRRAIQKELADAVKRDRTL